MNVYALIITLVDTLDESLHLCWSLEKVAATLVEEPHLVNKNKSKVDV